MLGRLALGSGVVDLVAGGRRGRGLAATVADVRLATLAAVGDPSSLKNDQSVPCSAIPEFVARGAVLVDAIVAGARAVPFGHIGDGNIHFNVWRPESMPAAEFTAHWPTLVRALEDLAMDLNGSIAAEHGIGSSKRHALGRVRDPVAVDLMRDIKRTLDPHGRLNPGKVVP